MLVAPEKTKRLLIMYWNHSQWNGIWRWERFPPGLRGFPLLSWSKQDLFHPCCTSKKNTTKTSMLTYQHWYTTLNIHTVLVLCLRTPSMTRWKTLHSVQPHTFFTFSVYICLIMTVPTPSFTLTTEVCSYSLTRKSRMIFFLTNWKELKQNPQRIKQTVNVDTTSPMVSISVGNQTNLTTVPLH